MSVAGIRHPSSRRHVIHGRQGSKHRRLSGAVCDDDDEVSEPEEASADEDADEPEYLGERNLSHGGDTSGLGEAYGCFKAMDIDSQGPEDLIAMPCVDIDQRGGPTTLYIDLTGPIDLTADDPTGA